MTSATDGPPYPYTISHLPRQRHRPTLVAGMATVLAGPALLLAAGLLRTFPALDPLSALTSCLLIDLSISIALVYRHRPTPTESATMPTKTRTDKAGLLTAALGYAARGWHVFPLRPGSKKPAIPDHPAHLCARTDPKCDGGHTGWEQRATTDPDRIERAWTTRPYGIGIATGPSGLVVLDLDTPSDPDHLDGAARLVEIEHREHQHLPTTLTVATPSGGLHLYYAAPPRSALGNTASRLAPYIDTRATGGYIVAPPTELDGRSQPYATITDVDPLPTLPGWLATLLTRATRPPGEPPRRPPATAQLDLSDRRLRRYLDAAIKGELTRINNAAAGTRNHTLFVASVAIGQLVGAGLLTDEHARQLLSTGADHHIDAEAYSRTEANRTIASGLTRGQTEPRTLPANLTTEPNQ